MAHFLTTFQLKLGCVKDVFLAPAPSTLLWTMYWGGSRKKSGCGVSFGIIRITDLDFADDAVICAETTEVLVDALESLSEEADPLGLRVSWIKTNVQAFGDILDATVESIPVNGENVEVTQTFTYLGSVIHSSTSCELEVNRRLR